MTHMHRRDLHRRLQDALTTVPVVVVTGMRQVGKTTFLQSEKSLAGWEYLTLDDLAVLDAARSDPESLVRGRSHVVLDEVQRVPDLLIAVKRAVDEKRRNGMFVLSGSANPSLMKTVSESLAGRALYLSMEPFSRRELSERTDRLPFLAELFDDSEPKTRGRIEPVSEEEVLVGGMPTVALGRTANRAQWFQGYEQNYVLRDVQEIARIRETVLFRRVLELVCHRTGQILNVSEIAREAQAPVRTVSDQIALLEVTCVISRLQPFLASRIARVVKSPKVHVADSGMAAAFSRVEDIGPASGERSRGRLIETYVAQNLRSIAGSHMPGSELNYFHVQGRHEVDFVVTWKRQHVAVEVKAGVRLDSDDFSGLLAFQSATKNVRALVLAYGGDRLYRQKDGIWVVPIGQLLS